MDIKEVLQKSGLTVGKFADSLYVSDRTVYNWLAGKTIPRQKQKQILDIYGERKLPAQTGEIDPD
jgi:DNA-binding transcriptional regulator YiaG